MRKVQVSAKIRELDLQDTVRIKILPSTFIRTQEFWCNSKDFRRVIPWKRKQKPTVLASGQVTLHLTPVHQFKAARIKKRGFHSTDKISFAEQWLY